MYYRNRFVKGNKYIINEKTFIDLKEPCVYLELFKNNVFIDILYNLGDQADSPTLQFLFIAEMDYGRHAQDIVS